jgi:hypothetical protein
MGRSQARPNGRGITLQLSGPVRSAGVQTTSRFRADVEGLRAVAVLAVVVYHAGLSQVGGGFVGVDVFYVLSGFLITGLLWEELQTTGRLRMGAFYGRQARRLLPAAVLVLMVTGRRGSPGWPRRSSRCAPPALRSWFWGRPPNQRWTCPTACRDTFTTPSPAPPAVGWPSTPTACGSSDRRCCAPAAATWTSPPGYAPARPAPSWSATYSPTATTTTSPPPTRPGCRRCSAISSTRPSGPVGAAAAANQETPKGTRARCLGMMPVHNELQAKPR